MRVLQAVSRATALPIRAICIRDIGDHEAHVLDCELRRCLPSSSGPASSLNPVDDDCDDCLPGVCWLRAIYPFGRVSVVGSEPFNVG